MYLNSSYDKEYNCTRFCRSDSPQTSYCSIKTLRFLVKCIFTATVSMNNTLLRMHMFFHVYNNSVVNFPQLQCLVGTYLVNFKLIKIILMATS